MAAITTSRDMANAGPTEITLVKLARVVMYVVLGYAIGMGTAQPVADWLMSKSKQPPHAIIQTNKLTQKPIVDTGERNHPPAKASK